MSTSEQSGDGILFNDKFMRNIIWCISTGFEHMLPGPHAKNGYYVDKPYPLSAEYATGYMVYICRGQSIGISSAIRPPYSYIREGTESELIKTTPEQPSKSH